VTRTRAEPPYDQAAPRQDAVLLVNLGTPAAPNATAVRRYLAEFLSDPRVVELPRALWLPILYGSVLAVRPAQSARKYALIWDAEGSPLAVHTARQASLLGVRFIGRENRRPVVEYAMRYGRPSVAEVLERLHTQGCTRILVVPLYPQYAASTTASVMDAVGAWLARVRHQPEIRFVKHFHTHPAYIEALAAGVRRHWQAHGRGDTLLMSFHGLPQHAIERGDPYAAECRETARLLAASLDLGGDATTLSFQSRFGRTAWIEPYTEATLVALARSGVGRVDVVCPGFVSDCLETLEEIGIAGRQAYFTHGGREFHLLPCLNESVAWINALEAIVTEHLWPRPDGASPPAHA
jgi:ferrochelatase